MTPGQVAVVPRAPARGRHCQRRGAAGPSPSPTCPVATCLKGFYVKDPPETSRRKQSPSTRCCFFRTVGSEGRRTCSWTVWSQRRRRECRAQSAGTGPLEDVGLSKDPRGMQPHGAGQMCTAVEMSDEQRETCKPAPVSEASTVRKPFHRRAGTDLLRPVVPST